MCPNHWSNVSGLLHSMGCKDMCVILAHASAYFLDFYSKRGNQLEALKVQGLEGDLQFIVTSCAFPFRNVMLCVQYKIYTSTSPRLQDPADVPSLVPDASFSFAESACRSGCQEEEIGNVIGSLIFIAHCYVQDELHGQLLPRHKLHVSLYVVLEDEHRSLLGSFQRHPAKFKVVWVASATTDEPWVTS